MTTLLQIIFLVRDICNGEHMLEIKWRCVPHKFFISEIRWTVCHSFIDLEACQN